MNWPASSDAMKAEGWEYDNDSTCRGCHLPIEWWISPAGKKTPVDVIPPVNPLKNNAELRDLHFKSCTERDRFKK